MSLVQRVTPIEQTDRESIYGTVKSVRRVISYDVFPPPEEPLQPNQTPHLHTVPAYKVSTAKRICKL
jgi:hypothetical protein